jgi:hypothetical protein
MDKGIYHVSFSSAAGSHGEGLAVVSDGAVNGGDPGYLYSGKFNTSGDQLSGRLAIKRWNTKIPSVFGPLGNFELDLSGTYVQANKSFKISGSVIGQPAMNIVIVGNYLSDSA